MKHKIWVVTHLYDIGSSHPEVTVGIFTDEKVAREDALNEAGGSECPLEDLTDASPEDATEVDAQPVGRR